MSWRETLWSDIRSSLVSKIVELLLGPALVTALLAALGKWAGTEITGGFVIGIFVASFAGLAVLFYLKRLSSRLHAARRRPTPTMNTILIYLPVAVGLLICFWAFILSKRVFEMSEDVKLLQARMTRYVLPRTLSLEQKTAISQYLSKFEPQPVNFVVISRNEEAGSFRADLAAGP